jgi:hypothetical protein
MTITQQRADLKSTNANTDQPPHEIDAIVAVMEDEEVEP